MTSFHHPFEHQPCIRSSLCLQFCFASIAVLLEQLNLSRVLPHIASTSICFVSSFSTFETCRRGLKLWASVFIRFALQWWTIVEALLALATGTPALRRYMSHFITIVAGYASLIAEWRRLLRVLPTVAERRSLLATIVARRRHGICRRHLFFFHCYAGRSCAALRVASVIDCRNGDALHN